MTSNNFCTEKFLEEYDSFLKQLLNLFDSNDENNTLDLINNFLKECESDKLQRGKNFYDSLELEYLFSLFCKSKVRLFSSKDENTNIVSNSLFGEDLPLKKLLNNQDENIQETIWKYLHLFYFLLETRNLNRTERKSKVSKLLKSNIESKNLSSSVKNDLLDADLNQETNNMIDDIVKSFEESLSKNSDNPFESIIEITQNITEKYTGKIESGDIELDKLMSSIQSNIPGMPNLGGGENKQKEKVIIDEDFSTDKVELGDKDEEKKSSGMNLNNMLKMMNSMNGGGNNPELGGLFSMLGKIDNINSNEEAEELKKEMDSYLENELGVDVNKLNKQFDDSNTIRIAEEDEPEQD